MAIEVTVPVVASMKVAVTASAWVAPICSVTEEGATASEVTGLVTVTAALALWPEALAVMLAVPTATPVTTPLALTVALVDPRWSRWGWQSPRWCRRCSCRWRSG